MLGQGIAMDTKLTKKDIPKFSELTKFNKHSQSKRDKQDQRIP